MIPNAAFDRALEQWLEAAAPTARPAGLHESVIQRAATIRQRPAWFAALRVGGFRRSPRRFVMTQMQLRLATAAVIGVIAIGGSLYIVQRGQPAAGTPSSSPAIHSSATPAPQSSQAAQMTVAAGATTTVLADGHVLIAGGYVYENGVNGRKYTFFDSAGLYDPATRTFTPTGSMATARGGHTATLLSDGRVLVAGGYGPAAPLDSAEIYDPSSGTFSRTGTVSVGVFDSWTATLLADGRVLFAGGEIDMGVCSASASIFDPKMDTFSPAGSMTAPRCGTATLLQDGRVLMTGRDSSRRSNPSSADIFDPTTGTFSPTGSQADGGTGQTATLLADGRVLVTGGEPAVGGDPLASAELYDPATGTFSPTGSMAVPREYHTATLLSDGRVLVTGGRPHVGMEGPLVTAAEIYDPATGTFSPAQ